MLWVIVTSFTAACHLKLLNQKSTLERNAAKHFLDSINEDLETIIKPKISGIQKMIYNEAAKDEFESALDC